MDMAKEKSDSTKRPVNRLKEVREAVKMSRETLAELYVSDPETIRRYEKSDRGFNYKKMIKLAKCLSQNELGINVEPYQLIIDVDAIIQKTSPILAKHYDHIHKYSKLEDADRLSIDRQIEALLALKKSKGSASITNSEIFKANTS